MADSFLDGIAGMVGGTLTPEIAAAFKGLPQRFEEVLSQATLTELPGQLQPLLESLQVDISPHAGDGAADAALGAVDATAEPVSFALPAGIDAAEFQGHLEEIVTKLQTLESDGQVKLTSADPNEQAHGQLLIQQAQALLEQVQSTLQQVHDATVDAVQNLHSNADGLHEEQGTVVAVADSGDGHVVGHADQDASVDHQVDHVSAPPAAHDDGATADPSAVA